MAGWVHPYAHLQDAARQRPFDGTWEEAQRYCNFPVLRPTSLPPGFVELAVRIRPEGGGGQGWSSVHATWAGPRGRFRIKQFLWDWCEPWSASNLRGQPDGCRVLSGDVAWFGRDYMGHPAACIGRHRTQVELSVLSGDLGQDELAAVLDGLRPVDEAVVTDLLAAPLHEISYTIRNRVAHWGMEDMVRLTWSGSGAGALEAAQPLLRRATAALSLPTFRVESVGWLVLPGGGLEVQLISRNPAQGTDMLWLRAISEGPVDPPRSGEGWSHRPLQIGGCAVRYEWAGPHGDRRAVWRAGAYSFDLVQRASPRVSESAFMAIVTALTPVSSI